MSLFRQTQSFTRPSSHSHNIPLLSLLAAHIVLKPQSTVGSRFSSRSTQRVLTHTPCVVPLRSHSKSSLKGHTFSPHDCAQRAVVGSLPKRAPPSQVHDAVTL